MKRVLLLSCLICIGWSADVSASLPDSWNRLVARMGLLGGGAVVSSACVVSQVDLRVEWAKVLSGINWNELSATDLQQVSADLAGVRARVGVHSGALVNEITRDIAFYSGPTVSLQIPRPPIAPVFDGVEGILSVHRRGHFLEDFSKPPAWTNNASRFTGHSRIDAEHLVTVVLIALTDPSHGRAIRGWTLRHERAIQYRTALLFQQGLLRAQLLVGADPMLWDAGSVRILLARPITPEWIRQAQDQYLSALHQLRLEVRSDPEMGAFFEPMRGPFIDPASFTSLGFGSGPSRLLAQNHAALHARIADRYGPGRARIGMVQFNTTEVNAALQEIESVAHALQSPLRRLAQIAPELSENRDGVWVPRLAMMDVVAGSPRGLSDRQRLRWLRDQFRLRYTPDIYDLISRSIVTRVDRFWTLVERFRPIARTFDGNEAVAPAPDEPHALYMNLSDVLTQYSTAMTAELIRQGVQDVTVPSSLNRVVVALEAVAQSRSSKLRLFIEQRFSPWLREHLGQSGYGSGRGRGQWQAFEFYATRSRLLLSGMRDWQADFEAMCRWAGVEEEYRMSWISDDGVSSGRLHAPHTTQLDRRIPQASEVVRAIRRQLIANGRYSVARQLDIHALVRYIDRAGAAVQLNLVVVRRPVGDGRSVGIRTAQAALRQVIPLVNREFESMGIQIDPTATRWIDLMAER